MKLPWVSREQYEQVKDTLTSERLRYQGLFERYHLLVVRTVNAPNRSIAQIMEADAMTNGNGTDIPLLRQEAAPPKRSVITETIREESQGDPRLARFLSRRSRELKAEKGLSEEEIAKELRTWESTEDIKV